MDKVYSNMRRLKRIPGKDGLTFTLETKQEQLKDNLLCNYCGWKEKVEGYDACKKYKRMERFGVQGLGVVIRSCDIYQPILTFRPPLGQYEESFNTFRLGSAWYNRVSPGTICALYNTVSGEIFGKAQVTETHHGDINEMCDEHAHNNHLFIGGDPEEASGKMVDAIRQAYGHIVKMKENPVCTVIYLENLGDADA